MTSRRPLLALPLLLALGLSGCGPFGGGPDPKEAAEKVATALQTGKVTASTFGGNADAVKDYERVVEPIKDFGSQVEVGAVKESGNRATATLTWTTDVSGHPWKRTTKIGLVRSGGTWKARWAPSVVVTGLKADEKLVVTRIKAERGNILGANNKPIVEPRAVTRFGIDKTQVPAASAPASARRLADALDVDPASFVKAVKAAGPKAFVQAVALRRGQVDQQLLDRVAAIKGARGIADHLPLAPTKEFAAALLGTVGPVTAELVEKSKGRLRAGDDTGLSGLQLRYDEQLFGTPGIKVSTGPRVLEEASDLAIEPRTLFEAKAIRGQDLRLTLSIGMQTEAEKLLTRYGPASALVAIRPSTGEILAAASGPGSQGYNTATFGQYAPGSTFKIVSSLALLRAGLTPQTKVSCPASVTVFGKKFKNYSDYPSNRLGTITLKQAVANSCNTAFISERAKVKGTALGEAAAALGFGVDHDTGFPAYFGQVPPPSGKTEAAADLIGQGKVLASPMAMATVVASVVKGATVLPVLVPAVKLEQTKPADPLTPAEARSLRSLMRAVVTEGSGIRLRSLGDNPPVYAKTGTAEFGTPSSPGAPLQTHTWMVGARGDLAVAVFVDVGQSGSQTAGPVLEAFLRAVG